VHIQLAWRNLWRNPRRTATILTAVIVGVLAMVTLGALMRGMADSMVRNAINTLTGHIQIHQKGFRSDPVIRHRMDDPARVVSVLERTLPAGAKWSVRVRVNAVVSNARHTAGVTLVGIDPEAESAVSFIGPEAVREGRYLRADDSNAVLAGQALVDDFETRPGHKLVVMSQGTGKEMASRAFRIKGIFDAELAATEKGFLFVTRAAAQEMLRLGEGVTEIAVLLSDRKRVDAVAADLRAALPEDYTVHTWRQLLPAITGYLDIFDNIVYLWYLIFFIAMGFGIVNTLLMAVFERMREFGVLKALGMKPRWIVRGVLTESFLLLTIGILFGNLLSFLGIWVLSETGIDLTAFSAGTDLAGLSRIVYPVLEKKDLAVANLVVFGLGLLISLYPAIKAARFTPVEAMAHT
jgi:ABC-type lipoprotein release transport system permease subunit